MTEQMHALVEGRWTPFARFVRAGSSIDSAADAVLSAGGTLKKKLGLRELPFRLRRSSSTLHLKVSGVAGSLSLKEAYFDVIPKFAAEGKHSEQWSAATLFLLESLAGKHASAMLAYNQKWKSHRVADIIGYAFADAVDRGMRDRPIHIYRSTEVSSVALRGTLNLSRQLRHSQSRPHLLECDVDELDDRNYYNDVLKWAANTLCSTVIDRPLRERLRAFAEFMPGNADGSELHRHMRLTPPPQFSAWIDALDLVRLLASGLVLPRAGGAQSGYSLMFNMERAFEKFVEVGLARSLKDLENAALSVVRQDSATFARPDFEGGKELQCRPDNVVRLNGRPLLLVDAKYKLLESELIESTTVEPVVRPKNPDVYELTAGMAAHGCKAGILVFPTARELDMSATWLRSWSIDVHGTPIRVGAVPVQLLHIHSRVDMAAAIAKLASELAAFEQSMVAPH